MISAPDAVRKCLMTSSATEVIRDDVIECCAVTGNPECCQGIFDDVISDNRDYR